MISIRPSLYQPSSKRCQLFPWNMPWFVDLYGFRLYWNGWFCGCNACCSGTIAGCCCCSWMPGCWFIRVLNNGWPLTRNNASDNKTRSGVANNFILMTLRFPPGLQVLCVTLDHLSDPCKHLNVKLLSTCHSYLEIVEKQINEKLCVCLSLPEQNNICCHTKCWKDSILKHKHTALMRKGCLFRYAWYTTCCSFKWGQ